MFRLQLNSFFPGADYRFAFLSEVNSLVYNGGGGFTHTDVWIMPIPIRRFHIQTINKRVEDLEKEREESSGVTRLSKDNNPMKEIAQIQQQAKKPPIPKEPSKSPTYSTTIKHKK